MTRIVLILLLMIIYSIPVYAEPCNADPVCRERNANGNRLFREKKYLEALGEFSGAYAVVRDPTILKNIGRSLHHLGQFKAALDHYEAYFQAFPRNETEEQKRVSRYVEEAQAGMSGGQRSGDQSMPIYVYFKMKPANPSYTISVLDKSCITPCMLPLNSGPLTVSAQGERSFSKTLLFPKGPANVVVSPLTSRWRASAITLMASGSILIASGLALVAGMSASSRKDDIVVGAALGTTLFFIPGITMTISGVAQFKGKHENKMKLFPIHLAPATE